MAQFGTSASKKRLVKQMLKQATVEQRQNEGLHCIILQCLYCQPGDMYFQKCVLGQKYTDGFKSYSIQTKHR